jgi:hypothetical protein
MSALELWKASNAVTKANFSSQLARQCSGQYVGWVEVIIEREVCEILNDCGVILFCFGLMSNYSEQIKRLYKRRYDRSSSYCPGDIMTLLVKTLHWTYCLVGKFLPMKYGSTLLYNHRSEYAIVCCRTQEAENYTQFVACKNVNN